MPPFTRAEVRTHISKSGKNIDPTNDTHSVPTSMRKATTFLNDEYLKDIKTCSDSHCFYFKCQCYHSYRKNDKPHDLKFSICIVTGEVKHACCSCVAGRVGFCNHVLALMMKVCLFSLYECKNTNDLINDGDVSQPKKACTSQLQQWHRKGRGTKITPQPAMDVYVTKTSLDNDKESKREPGLGCLLYEARKTTKTQSTLELNLLKSLQEINPKMALAQIMTPRCNAGAMTETKMGRSPQGSFASYQLAITEDNFKVYCDVSTVTRKNDNQMPLHAFPRLPLRDSEDFKAPDNISTDEQTLLGKITVTVDLLNKIEQATRGQSNSDEWKEQRRLRITASNFGRVKSRKRQHESLVKEFLDRKSFTSKYTTHGLEYESTALNQYRKYMCTIGKPVQVFKSGLVVCLESPYLGASPDGKVIDNGCSEPFGLVEIKCPHSMFDVTPLDACSHRNFYLEEVDGKPKLKHGHNYYSQVQGQMAVTGARWCDFVVYTRKGLSIERIPYDPPFWLTLKESLRSFYFTHFLSFAAKNSTRQD